MISMSFINSGGRNELDRIDYECQLYLESVDGLIQDILYDYKHKMNMVALESSIMDEVNEVDMVYLEEEKKSIVQKLGSVIISIFEKVIKAIKDFQEWLKNFGFRKKSSSEKLDKMISDHPELKDEIIASFKKGELNLTDIRTLKELDSAYEEILRLAKDEKTEPKTLKEKWSRAVKKFDEQNSAVVKAGKVAAGVTAVITAGVAVYTLNQRIKESKLTCIESKKSLEKNQKDTYELLMNEGVISKDTGRHAVITAISRDYAGKHEAAAKRNNSIIEKLQNKIDNFLDKADDMLKKINGDKKEALHKNMETAINREREKEEKERQKKITETREIEQAKADIRRADQEAHADEDARRAAEQTARNTRAKLDEERRDRQAHAAEDDRRHSNQVYNDEWDRQQARADFNGNNN